MSLWKNNMESRDYEWDGVDRRSYHNQEVILQQLHDMMIMMNQQKNTDISKSTLTMRDVIAIVGGLGSLLIGCFIVWNNLNNTISENQREFELFKNDISKTVQLDNKNLDELKVKLNNIENNIKELDSTITQMYNKLNKK
jgi:indole-3-glycerol phosphate synthase